MRRAKSKAKKQRFLSFFRKHAVLSGCMWRSYQKLKHTNIYLSLLSLINKTKTLPHTSPTLGPKEKQINTLEKIKFSFVDQSRTYSSDSFIKLQEVRLEVSRYTMIQISIILDIRPSGRDLWPNIVILTISDYVKIDGGEESCSPNYDHKTWLNGTLVLNKV